MRSFVPRLGLAVLLPPARGLEEKFGGLPDGLPPQRWPFCRQCHAPMLLLAQLRHHPERLELGGEGRVLYVFQCDNGGECETWDARSGANAALVLEPGELLEGPTPPPDGAPRETEARVLEWRAQEDGVRPEQVPAFFSDEALFALPEEVRAGVGDGTRLGGVPFWVQGAEEGPGAPWRFVAQLGSVHHFEGAPPSGAPQWVRVEEEGGYSCSAANYGDAGMGYVFVRTDTPRAQACFFWQCA